jgi:hypothetical protein
MDLPEDELNFLRALVKTSRQKTHHVTWVDRDGVERHTVLNQPEVVRLNQLAQRLKVSKAETLRLAAQLPAPRPPKPDAPAGQ